MIEELTKREKQVYDLLLKGCERNKIVNLMNLSRGTIDTYIEHIYLKMCVNSQRELMAKRIQELEGVYER